MDARRPPGFVGSGRLHASARHRRAGPRSLSRRSSTACASRSRSASSAGAIALVIGATLGIERGLCRRAHRGADHAHRRPAALVPGDPARARARGAARPGQGAADRGAGRPRNTPISPAPRIGAASAERRKDYVEAALSTPLSGARIVFRHILPNSLPPLIVVATRADRERDLARGDAVVPGARPAADRAVARHADRQRLPVHDVAAATGSRSIPASR